MNKQSFTPSLFGVMTLGTIRFTIWVSESRNFVSLALHHSLFTVSLTSKVWTDSVSCISRFWSVEFRVRSPRTCHSHESIPGLVGVKVMVGEHKSDTATSNCASGRSTTTTWVLSGVRQWIESDTLIQYVPD